MDVPLWSRTRAHQFITPVNIGATSQFDDGLNGSSIENHEPGTIRALHVGSLTVSACHAAKHPERPNDLCAPPLCACRRAPPHPYIVHASQMQVCPVVAGWQLWNLDPLLTIAGALLLASHCYR